MSAWTHAACLPCYGRTQPGRTPYRVVGAEEELCCLCGEPTSSGIYVRADPKSFGCKGLHREQLLTDVATGARALLARRVYRAMLAAGEHLAALAERRGDPETAAAFRDTREMLAVDVAESVGGPDPYGLERTMLTMCDDMGGRP
jgi:hypothetical protein